MKEKGRVRRSEPGHPTRTTEPTPLQARPESTRSEAQIFTLAAAGWLQHGVHGDIPLTEAFTAFFVLASRALAA